MTDPKHTEPVVVVTPNDSMCGGLYPVHGSVTHGRTVECCDFCGLPADYEPARTAAEAASRQEVERLREALEACTAMMDSAALALDGGMPDLDDAICCSGHDCMCRGSSNRELLTYDLRETARKARAALTASEAPDA